jgi:23S rRNA (uracil1939-C5)-methyltransferase
MPLILPLEPFEVEITGLSSHAEGIARYENKVIFVTGALPGEKCKVKIAERYRKMARAEIVELVHPSPHRINPPCPHYPIADFRLMISDCKSPICSSTSLKINNPYSAIHNPQSGCGGCQLQHLDYSSQLEYKRQTVSDALQHIAKSVFSPKSEVRSLPDVALSAQLGERLRTQDLGLGTALLPNPVISGTEFGYRNKVTFPLTVDNEKIAAGLHYRNSYKRIVPIINCLILEESLQRILQPIVAALNQVFTPEDVAPSYATNSPEAQQGWLRYLILRSFSGIPTAGLVVCKKKEPLLTQFAEQLKQIPSIRTAFIHLSSDPNDYLWTEDKTEILFGETRFPINLGFAGVSSFLQVNKAASEKLYEYVLQLPVQGNRVALDTYCGIGLLSLELANQYEHVIGIDSDNAGINLARYAAERQNMANIEFITGAAEKVFRVWKKTGHFQMPEFLDEQTIQRMLGFAARIDTVILDPPRSGIHPKVIKRLGEILPKDIILVSCHPATLARDLTGIMPFGYQVQSVQPFDMFPQTFHVETVIHLKKI